MLDLTFAIIWTTGVFAPITYITLLVSAITYLVPIICTAKTQTTTSTRKTAFAFINATETLPLTLLPYLTIFFITLIWTGPATSAWFGHILISHFQVKLTPLVLAVFATTLLVLTSTTHFSSREVYDYLNTTYSVAYWIILLFFANSIMTVIFIIEVLSATLFLLVITSTFSSTYFYRNLNLSFGHLFQQTTPHTYLQSILFFFWISLISSLNLFLFCILFYLKVLTLDWSVGEHIFLYFINTTAPREAYALGLGWFVLCFCLFLKCGLAPLYIWKPIFFKGIPLYTLFFYVTFFYFFLFIYNVHLLTSYFGEVLYFYAAIMSTMVFIGLLSLLVLLCEAFYFKAFLAMSSILNSILVFLALTTPHVTDTLLWL